MTPAARYSAAIGILDRILGGEPAEKALTVWARQNRYAGSKDRAAVRDHVFEVLRKKRSCAAFGGGENGRALVLGLLRLAGADLNAIFSGDGYAPAKLAAKEMVEPNSELTIAERHDLPDWMWDRWCAALGGDAASAAMTQRERATVALRVNPIRGTVAQAVSALKSDEIHVVEHAAAPGCLLVETNHRRVAQSSAFSSGLVELQDASSQMAVLDWPVDDGHRVLDYCAGGGGKSLALACSKGASVTAHDIEERRTRDIPARAKRAGVKVPILSTDDLDDQGAFDVVVCDAPCSGSGTWRRTPDAKWRLTERALAQFHETQRDVLEAAKRFLHADGMLIYATCSVFSDENQDVVSEFLRRNDGFVFESHRLIVPSSQNDGFYYCVLRRN